MIPFAGDWMTYPALQLPIGLAMVVLIVFTLVRFGLAAGFMAYLVGAELTDHPLTLDFSTWYAASTLIPLGFAVALTLFGFFTSLGGRPLFRDDD